MKWKRYNTDNKLKRSLVPRRWDPVQERIQGQSEPVAYQKEQDHAEKGTEKNDGKANGLDNDSVEMAMLKRNII